MINGIATNCKVISNIKEKIRNMYFIWLDFHEKSLNLSAKSGISEINK